MLRTTAQCPTNTLCLAEWTAAREWLSHLLVAAVEVCMAGARRTWSRSIFRDAESCVHMSEPNGHVLLWHVESVHKPTPPPQSRPTIGMARPRRGAPIRRCAVSDQRLCTSSHYPAKVKPRVWLSELCTVYQWNPLAKKAPTFPALQHLTRLRCCTR